MLHIGDLRVSSGVCLGVFMPVCEFQNRDGTRTVETVPACCRCGVCCLSEPCSVGVLAYGIPPGPDLGHTKGRCPGLSFDAGGLAVCAVIADKGGEFSDVWQAIRASTWDERARVMGFGVGCCIRARAFWDGKQSNFATLPAAVKRWVSRMTVESAL